MKIIFKPVGIGSDRERLISQEQDNLGWFIRGFFFFFPGLECLLVVVVLSLAFETRRSRKPGLARSA